MDNRKQWQKDFDDIEAMPSRNKDQEAYLSFCLYRIRRFETPPTFSEYVAAFLD